jgi:hypothetical protein
MLPFEKINTAVSSLLADNPNPTDQDIRALALDLAMQEYEAVIRSRIGTRDRKLEETRRYADNGYYVFVEPDKPPVTVSEGKTEVVMEKSPRQSYKVRDKDLAAFAKQFGLDEMAMREVGMGQRHDWKGWTRGVGMMNQYELGQPFRTHKVKPVLPLSKEQKAVRVVRPWSVPTIDWTPEN